MVGRFRSLVLATSLIGLAVVFSLVCFEVALRVLDLYRAPPNPLVAARPHLYQPDEKLGYRLWPSTTSCDRYPPKSPHLISIVSNSSGFRNSREFGEPDARRRILVAGDSFVFGSGVRAEQRLTEVLESLEPAWRVENLGMEGWGIDLMVRAIEHVGPAARPDVVVLSVYTDDFRRVLPDYTGMGYPIPKFRFEGDRLVTIPYPAAAGWRRLRIVQFAYHMYWRYVSDRNRYDLNRALLERFLNLAKRQGFQPALAFLPGRTDTGEDQQRRRFLRDWAALRKVPYLDLTEPIHSAGVKNVYLSGNWHWNAAGHRVAAQAFLAFLRTRIGDNGR